VGARFKQVNFWPGQSFEPIGKLIGEQLAINRAHADVSVKVSGPANYAGPLLIIATIWTVKGHFHEPGEGDDPLPGNGLAQY
jgi:hypothetical protein